MGCFFITAVIIIWMIIITVAKSVINHKESLPDTPKYTLFVKILEYDTVNGQSYIIAENVYHKKISIKDHDHKYRGLVNLLIGQWVNIELRNKCVGILFLQVDQYISHIEKIDLEFLKLIKTSN